MSSNVCGNCSNFIPKPGERFVNCTEASHGGLSYGMQVRPDTRACDAFMSIGIDIDVPLQAIQPARLTEDTQPVESSEPVGLCTVGQKSLVASVSVAIILVSWLLYTCAQS
ncbi:hypothetical protein ACFLXV_00700 [Chloroflexota bacterium]